MATEWKQFQELDPVAARKLVAGDNPTVLDGRNCLPRKEWEAAGWNFLALGRG